MALPNSHMLNGARSGNSHSYAAIVDTDLRPATHRSRPKTSTSIVNRDGMEIICAVTEARGLVPTVGLSFLNITTSEAVLCQFADTQTYARTCHKICAFDPTLILYANTSSASKLVSVLHENINTTRHQAIELIESDRRYWSESSGFDRLERLAHPDELKAAAGALNSNYFAICCFAAVSGYTNICLHVTFAPHTLRIRFESSEGTMIIDPATVTSLELVQNLEDVKSKNCLFGLLNETLTRMGYRMLKSNILQPSTDKTKILRRSEAVEELITTPVLLDTVRGALEHFVDTDKVLAALVTVHNAVDLAYMEQSVNNVIMLKTFIESIMPVRQALSSAKSAELRAIYDLCEPESYAGTEAFIRCTINEDVQYSTKAAELRNQRVWAIRAGSNGFLDVARAAYKEINEDIADLVQSLISKYLASIGLHLTFAAQHEIQFKLKFHPMRQYYLVFKVAELHDREIPDGLINIYPTKGLIECQTMDLIKLNQKVRESHNDVVTMSDFSVQELIIAVRPLLYPLIKIGEAVALLDMLASFAQVAQRRNYIRPELTNTLAIQSGRHPIREKVQQDTKFVANDYYATRQSRFQIITGCNMSGKSTYIHTVALTAVMVQMGCFVPARYASFPLIHQLFARISTDDNVEANVSSFSAEMKEMAFILRNVDSRSLVIVDELGRGTSTRDGLAIAIAISEALIESQALIWFVTHFRDLPRVLAERAGVVNLHLDVVISPDYSQIKMKYKVTEGAEEHKYYGIAMAKLMNFPPSIIDQATKISAELHRTNDSRQQSAGTLAVARRRNLALKVREQLMLAKESKVDNETLVAWLRRLQEELLIRMSAIDAEVAAAEAHVEADTAVATPPAAAGNVRAMVAPDTPLSSNTQIKSATSIRWSTSPER